jgi:hypothetical protein
MFCRAERIKNKRFLEVDFMISESSFWIDFFDDRTIFIPEVMKIMDRGAANRISFSGKMEYCRGKAYSIATCEGIQPTLPRLNYNSLWKIITYHRYCFHGDIGMKLSRELWDAKVSLVFWLMMYPVGVVLAVKDMLQRKVVKTHIEFDRNSKLASIRIID